MNEISISLPPEAESAVRNEIAAWSASHKISSIWNRDANIWTNSGEENWLGWLNLPETESQNIAEYQKFAKEVSERGFETTVLLGMGGSSLAPEVYASVINKRNFHILDSTVPAAIVSLEKELDLSKTLFIVSSKSGSTLEPNCLMQYFLKKVSQIAGGNASKQFIAITDPGSQLEKEASEFGFLRVFHGQPTVGGRFSALSAFGLVPAAIIGFDISRLLDRARQMAQICQRADAGENPAALLGIILGILQKQGRDKLTIFSNGAITDFSAWLEQLIAESTGKNQMAIIPIANEPLDLPENYSTDRVFVHLAITGESDDQPLNNLLTKLETFGHPVLRIKLESREHIVQEFFRWEFATAVAGAIMGINPFDQPDVESAKIAARKITDKYETSGKLDLPKPIISDSGISLFTDQANRDAINSDMTRDETGIANPTVYDWIRSHLKRADAGDYIAILAYLEMSEVNLKALEGLRQAIVRLTHRPVTLGFGPRFLHSTGQAHKGGPNSGVFLQITADDQDDLEIPNRKFTFSVVKNAQALGDFNVLLERKRRAIHLKIENPIEKQLFKIAESLK